MLLGAHMNLDYYQTEAKQTAVYPKQTALEYLVLGLNGEAGEVANVYKKYIRSRGRDGLDATDTFRETHERMVDEIGDCLWYVALLADELGLNLSALAQQNLDKLNRRYNK